MKFSTIRLHRSSPLMAAVLLLAATASSFGATADGDAEWPSWRGPLGNGTVAEGNPPTTWSEDENIQWKVELPGLGSSTPVVIGNQLVLTLAIDTGKTPDGKTTASDRNGRRPDNVHEWYVVSYDRTSAKELWRTKVREGLPHEGSHQHATWASNSPVTDGEHIWAYFGSMGLFKLDLEGTLVWAKDYGLLNKSNAFGDGASPALHGDTLILQRDHQGTSSILAVNKNTGEEIWSKERDEASSWSTPIVVEVDGKAQVITNATTNVRAYDLESGEVIWQTTGMTDNVIPSPVHGNGMVYLMSGFRGYKILAVGLEGAKGDVTGTDSVIWSYDKDTPYVVSPLLYDGVLYFFKVLSPILSALDARTGEVFLWPRAGRRARQRLRVSAGRRGPDLRV